MTKRKRAKKSLINFQTPSFIITENQRVDFLFELWEKDIPAASWDCYKNHVYRVLNLVRGYLGPKEQLSFEKLSIVAAFHDVDLFSNDNFNYLESSNAHMLSYLNQQGMGAWQAELSIILRHHHKLTQIRDNRLAEIFRVADLADLSLGILKSDIPQAYYDALHITFPSLKFRRSLLKKSIGYGLSHPWNPLPMFKW